MNLKQWINIVPFFLHPFVIYFKMNEMLISQLNEFRTNPKSIIDQLHKRKSRYFQHRGKTYFGSSEFQKKLLLIKDIERPERRIDELIELLDHEKMKGLKQLKVFERLSELAQKICDGIDEHMSKQHNIQLKSGAKNVLRNWLDEDPDYSYPDKVVCLIGLTFNDPQQPLISLLVDDGNEDRSNRDALLQHDIKYIGVSSLPITFCSTLRCTIYLLTTRIDKK